MIASSAIAELEAATGGRNLLVASDLASLDPGIHPDNLGAGLAVLPATTLEVARVLAICSALRIAVVPQGGRTGLAAGATSAPGELILSLSRMRRIEALDAAGGTAIVEAGVPLQLLNEAASVHGLSAGIDLGARGSCTIGGMISTNAGGMEAFRHGSMRQRVLGLEAVLADGRILSDLTQVLKANQGYDVKQLFIGAEGTLGVVTRAVVKLETMPGLPATALAVLGGMEQAVALLRQLERLAGTRLTHAELMSRNQLDVTAGELCFERLLALGAGPVTVLVEVAAREAGAAGAALELALGAALEEGLVTDAILASSERERAELWRVREDWAVDRVFPGGLWYDVSVPLPALGAYLSGLRARLDPALQLFVIGHLADGNLHLTVNADRPIGGRYDEVSAVVYDGLVALGGAFSAEHGIGLEKQAALLKYLDPVKLEVMRAVKRTLDPHGIMNPGKVLPVGG